MKLYAIIEFDSDIDTDLHISDIRRTLKQVSLSNNSQTGRVGVCHDVECSKSVMDSLEQPFYHHYRVKVSEVLSVDIGAIDNDDAIAKTRIIIKDDSEFVIHNKPEWWEITIIK